MKKQEYAHELLKQIFIAVDPYELSVSHKEYFSLLLRFQETNSEYLKSYRDHLIHTLRVFLLVIAIFEKLGDTWIEILKDLLVDLLKKLREDIDPVKQMEKLEGKFWFFSIRGAAFMSLFHDIGMVYSKHREMMETFDKSIFMTSEGEDLSIFEWQPYLKKEWEEAREKISPEFKELSEKYHPEYGKLHQTLEDDLEKIKALDIEDIHGTLSFFLLFRLYGVLKSFLLDAYPKLDKKLMEASSRPEVSTRKMNTKDRKVADNEGEISREKLEDVVDMLVLYEAMNAIFVHDKESHVALSPFSEILVFADNSQEWDRFECKNGKPIDYAKDKIKICVDNCDGQETLLSFYEEPSFEQVATLNDIISKLSSILNDLNLPLFS